MRRLIAVGCVVAVAGVATFAAQQARDRAPGSPPPAGTSRLSGRVTISGADARPLSRVIVTLTGEQLPGGRATITNGDGQFAFDRLPAGRYTVTGTKPAYLPGGFGMTRPGRAPIPLALGAGESRTDVRFEMTHGAAITGILRDANGDPAPGVDVAALRVPLPGARPVLTLVTWASTDDRGVYRIYGLPAGDYYVSSMMRAAARTSDVSALTSAQVDDALAALQRGTTTSSAGVSAAQPGGTFGLTPVFFPGTAVLDAATRMTLAAGDERAGVDFTVRLTRMATIEGVVIDGGHPIKPLIINPTGFEMPSLTGSAPTYSSQVTPTGRNFKYTNVVPGRYTLTAESTEGVAWAKAEIEVIGDDVRGLTMVLQPALRMTGRIVFEPGQLNAPDVTRLDLRVLGPRGAYSSSVGTTRMGQAVIPPAVINANGSFEIAGLIPDTYRFNLPVPGASGWTLRSAIVNGIDVLDRPFEVGSSDVNGAVLTFSDRQTSLTGTISTAAGQPAPAYFIAVFPADRALWRPQARRIQSARSGTDGSWVIKGLPAGEYLVAALADLGPEDLADPAFLGELVAASVKVSLAEGEQKVQPLRISAR